jgi:hypothetical protein
VNLSRAGAVWATLAVAVALAAVHLFAPWIRRRLPLTSQAIASFGGGIAATYVFLYLLPRLAEGNQAVATTRWAAGSSPWPPNPPGRRWSTP